MLVYGEDLAYIHDTAHGDFARVASPALLHLLHTAGIASGLVVDLGCGSGLWAQELLDAGYRVLGIDLSEAMIALARNRAPTAEFRSGSFLTAELPPCVAVTSIGECLSYLFDTPGAAQVPRLFHRVHTALAPGGLFIFDVVAPGRIPGRKQRSFREGDDWAVLVDADEDLEDRLLTRRITTFRKVGELYRRTFEVHRCRLFDRRELSVQLREAGFRVRPLRGYGSQCFVPGQIGFLARKP